MRLAPTAVIALCLAAGACTPEPPPAPPEVPPTVPGTTAAPPSPSASAAAPAPSGPVTLFVRETRADCEGEGPQKCLQVRSAAADPWTLHYGSIEGFHYEDGYAYELKVAIETVSHPPADATTKRFKLVEVVSKTKP